MGIIIKNKYKLQNKKKMLLVQNYNQINLPLV